MDEYDEIRIPVKDQTHIKYSTTSRVILWVATVVH